MEDGNEKSVFRQTVDFIVISYLIMVGHLAVLLLTTYFRPPVSDKVISSSVMVSSALFVLKLNERMIKIDSQRAQSLATLCIFPGWLVVFFNELFMFVNAAFP